MSSVKYILPALAFAGWASAQCSASGTLTIQNQGDAGALAGCATFSGSIAIATGTVDPINIPAVRVLTGDLTVKNVPNITSIGADSLQKIQGTFGLNTCSKLNSVSFPQLFSVGSVDFQGLANLNNLGTNINTTNSLNIQNTFLSSLDGFKLKQVQSITIANNRQLQNITFQVKEVSKTISIQSNGDRLLASFPNLQTVQNLTFNSCPSISIPTLKNVSGSLGFYSNTFDTVSAPNLTFVGGTLAINSNKELTNVSLPALTTVNGGFQVQNNTKLTDVEIDSLQTIGGAFDFFGAFSSVKVPGLKNVKGAFNLQSTGDIDCGSFSASNNGVKGKFFCKGNLNTPGGQGTNSGGGKKSGAVGHVKVSSSLVGLTGFLIALVTMF